MIKIFSVSDLHLEFYNLDENKFPTFDLPEDLDILILAGDIINGHKKGIHEKYITWLTELSKKAKHTLFVKGNHDLYNSRPDKFDRDFKALTKNTNIKLLENDTFIYKGYKFIGATTWIDFQLFLGENEDIQQRIYHRDISNSFDFKKIKIKSPQGFRKLNPFDIFKWNQQSKKFILNELDKNDGYKNILITHHGVFKESIQERLNIAKPETIDPLFFTETNDWGDLILNSENPPILVINGHSHDCKDIQVGENTRLWMNCYGYYFEDNDSYLIKSFNDKYIIKI